LDALCAGQSRRHYFCRAQNFLDGAGVIICQSGFRKLERRERTISLDRQMERHFFLDSSSWAGLGLRGAFDRNLFCRPLAPQHRALDSCRVYQRRRRSKHRAGELCQFDRPRLRAFTTNRRRRQRTIFVSDAMGVGGDVADDLFFTG